MNEPPLNGFLSARNRLLQTSRAETCRRFVVPDLEQREVVDDDYFAFEAIYSFR